MQKTRDQIIEDVHQAFGLPINALPTVKLLTLRRRLVEEEVAELFADVDQALALLEKGEEVPQSLWSNMLKELADVQTVISGLSVSLKPLYKLEEAFHRVFESNMSKLGPDGKSILREDGKFLKGPNYQPPVLDDLV